MSHVKCALSRLLLRCSARGSAAGARADCRSRSDPLLVANQRRCGHDRVSRFAVDVDLRGAREASVRVVPDESRLAVAAIQLAPFEADWRNASRGSAQRRTGDSSSTTTRLRIIDRERHRPATSVCRRSQIHYRVQRQVQRRVRPRAAIAPTCCPAEPIRVLSLVPADAADIRDGADESVRARRGAAVPHARARYRRHCARPAAALVVAVPASSVHVRRTSRTTDGRRIVSDRARRCRAVDGGAGCGARVESRGGWSPELVGRALTAAADCGGMCPGPRASRSESLGPTATCPMRVLSLSKAPAQAQGGGDQSRHAADVERVLR